MIIKNLKKYFTFEVQVSWSFGARTQTQNSSPLIHTINRSTCRCWTTRMCVDASVPVTINRPPVWNPSFVRCRCDWTRAGIKFNSICPISQDARMARITWKRCVCKFTPIAGYDECISPIDCIRKTNYPQNSNCSCPYRSRCRALLHHKHAIDSGSVCAHRESMSKPYVHTVWCRFRAILSMYNSHFYIAWSMLRFSIHKAQYNVAKSNIFLHATNTLTAAQLLNINTKCAVWNLQTISCCFVCHQQTKFTAFTDTY